MMKTLEDSNSSEFSIRDFSEIKKDKLLKQKEVLKEKESVFSKSSNGKWKFLFVRKKKSVMPTDPYIVCQQLQVILYQSLSFFNQLTKKNGQSQKFALQTLVAQYGHSQS